MRVSANCELLTIRWRLCVCLTFRFAPLGRNGVRGTFASSHRNHGKHRKCLHHGLRTEKRSVKFLLLPKDLAVSEIIRTFAAENRLSLKKRHRFFPTHRMMEAFFNYDLLHIETNGSGRLPSTEPVV